MLLVYSNMHWRFLGVTRFCNFFQESWLFACVRWQIKGQGHILQWAYNENFVDILAVHLIRPKIFHMPWQLSCHDVHKIVTWSDNCFFLCKSTIFNRFRLWAHRPFVKWFPGSMPPCSAWFDLTFLDKVCDLERNGQYIFLTHIWNTCSKVLW